MIITFRSEGKETQHQTESCTVTEFLISNSINLPSDFAVARILGKTSYQFIDVDSKLPAVPNITLSLRQYKRPLSVHLATDEKKTVMIDEREPVSSLLSFIGSKLGLRDYQHQEFGLRLDFSSPFLRINRTLGEQGVSPSQSVYLCRRIFLSPTDPSFLKFHVVAWTEYNRRLLSNELPNITRDDVVQLGALHLMSFVGTSQIKASSMNLSEYVPMGFHDDSIAGDIIQRRDTLEISSADARLEFCLYMEKLEHYSNLVFVVGKSDSIVFTQQALVLEGDEPYSVEYSDIFKFSVDHTSRSVIVDCKLGIKEISSVDYEEIAETLQIYCKILNVSLEPVSIANDFSLVRDLKDEVSELTTNLTQQTEENQSLKDENQSLKDEVSSQMIEISSISSQLSSKDDEICTLLKQIEEKDLLIQSHEQKLTDLGVDIEKERCKQKQFQEKLGNISWVRDIAKNFFEKNDGSSREIDRNLITPVVVDGKIVNARLNIPEK
ncbi:hypothetical protein GEMRC1_006488 [Eukaryota sp. GEM-RC1]